MPKKKHISEREKRRIATRIAKNGEDFDSRNGKYASQFNKTKFNSETGRQAALKRHRAARERKQQEEGGGTL